MFNLSVMLAEMLTIWLVILKRDIEKNMFYGMEKSKILELTLYISRLSDLKKRNVFKA